MPDHRQIPRCIREGCTRNAARGHDTCSTLCRVIHQELESAQRIGEATGDGNYWAAAVALNDALTDYIANYRRVGQAARDVGISRKQWAALKRGGTV